MTLLSRAIGFILKVVDREEFLGLGFSMNFGHNWANPGMFSMNFCTKANGLWKYIRTPFKNSPQGIG